MQSALATIAHYRIVPLVVLERAEQAVPLMEALVRGGLPVAEIAFRTPVAAASIAAIREAGIDATVGAGTVLTTAQVEAAVAAGAEFIVSPGLSPSVAKRCRDLGVAYVPGAVTATEITAALDLGISTVKFFPASTSGGAAAIRALSAPFDAVRFIPTGGIDAGSLRDYLALHSVTAVGGSWMVPRRLIDAGDWDAITELVGQAVADANS
ncbi:MAG: bifunctional 4-hydroxy-2-oxoglutarate aldolase/2-dehydro-3-deoxy-phosphogluconate aldolase [Actinomycetaceae bacterium]|nr:bifunctional 4-hydroxy-2-oxoglutarate aldolase/2-dehydro-3-deoxy-phosphogluconate aldolase [Actinomycetaceae bacterium]